MTQKTEPMLHKFSNLLRLPIFLAKLRKPFIPKLIFLKKSRKLKRFKLLKHYDYRFKEEYEFSPSSTPLIYYQTRRFRSGSGRDALSMLFLCRCFGGVKGRGEDADRALSWDWDALPPIPGELLESKSDKEEEDEDSVDQRAEKFIQGFYEEIRMQKQESI